jgi:F0F1-type ATP synthase assembly protein I
VAKQDNLGENLTEGLRSNVTKDFGPFLSMGFQLAAGVTVFFFIGYWLDGKFGTSPWCAVGGGALGAAGGLTKFVRDALSLGKKADEELFTRRSIKRSPEGEGGRIEKQKREAR